MQRLFLAGGTAALGYCALVLGDTWIFQWRARQVLAQRASEQPLTGSVVPHVRPAIGADGLIGRIDIPRIGVSAVISEGTGRVTLRRSVGHISYTSSPGQPGNTGLAGHRDSFFRPLKDIRPDDTITVTTTGGEYRYRVVSTHIVKPTDVSVLLPTGNEVLTLVTCYPFHYVGAAPERFVVLAERVI